MSENETPHPWGEFLKARKNVIMWMHKKSMIDLEISDTLSMTEEQVYQIRKYGCTFHEPISDLKK